MAWGSYSNLPDGCGRLPGEEPDPPCDLCGNDPAECICPECENCGAHGCIEHLDGEALLHRLWAASKEVKRRGGEQRILHDNGDCPRAYGEAPNGKEWPCEFCDSPVGLALRQEEKP